MPNITNKYLWLPIALTSIVSFFYLLVRFFTPVYLSEELGFSGNQIGLLFGIFSIAGIFFVFPVGLGSDRFSPKRMIQIFSVLIALAVFSMAYFQNFWALVVIFFIFGLSKNATNIAINTEVFKKVDNKEIGTVFGIFNFASAFFAAIGMIVGGFLLQKYSFQFAFVVQAIGFLSLFILAFKLSYSKTVEIDLLKNFKDFFNPKVLVFSVVLFLFAMHWGAEDVAYGLFLKKNLALSEREMGLYMAGEVFCLAFAALYFGFRIQKNNISFKKMFIIGLLLSGITHILMTVPELWFSFTMRMIHGVGDGAMAIVLFFGIKKLFQVDRIGGSGGLIMLVNMLGAFTGSIIFGAMTKYGYEWPLIVSGIITLCLVLIVLGWQKHIN